MKEKVLQAMREFGAPVNAGKIAEITGIFHPFLCIIKIKLYLCSHESDCRTADGMDGTAQHVVTIIVYGSEVRRGGWCTV